MATITGTSGNDTYAGTVGINDTAIIDALQDSLPQFRFSGDAWTVTSSQGSDTLTSIEQVQLLDGTFSLGVGGLRTVATNTYTPLRNNNDVVRLSDGTYATAQLVQTGQGLSIFGRKMAANGEFVSSFTINTPSIGQFSQQPVMASLGATGFVVAWYEPDANGTGIAFRRFDAAGNALGGKVAVNTTLTAGAQTEPAITTLANGNFVIGWTDDTNDGSGNGVYARMFTSAGVAVTGEFRVNTTVAGSQSQPAFTALSGGGFVATFNTGNNTYFQRYDSAGGALGGETLAGAFSQNGPATVIGLSNDRFLVAGSLGLAVRFRIFDASGFPDSPELIVNNPNLASVSNIEAVSLSDGGWVIAWSQTVLSPVVHSELHTQRYDSLGNKVGGETTVSETAPGDIHLAAGANGDYTIQWLNGSDVVQLRYDADNLPVLASVTGDISNNVITGSNAATSGLRLVGGLGNDILTGTAFADILDGTDGADRLIGGAGNDTYIVNGDDRIVENEGSGLDTVVTRESYTLTARSIENLRLLGTSPANLTGNGVDNTIYGNRADNVINGRGGADTMIGGNGNDTYYVDSSLDTIIENANEGIDTMIAVSGTLPNNVENFRATGTNNSIISGNALDNHIIGNNGANVIDGQGGADILQGRGGDDVYYVGAGDQIIEGLDNGDDFALVNVSYVLDDNVEGASLIAGGVFNLTGNDLANQLSGNSDANILDGGAGADTMRGFQGADIYIVDNVGDVVIDGDTITGADEVRASVSFSLTGTDAENLTLTGKAAIDGTGSNAGNVIRGNAAANVITGVGGSDTLYGNGGNDQLIAGANGNSTLAGGTGNDTYTVSAQGDLVDTIVELANQGTDTILANITGGLYALPENVENLTLIAGFGSAGAVGNSLSNVIIGDAGNNILDGGGGADVLSGGLGDDIYVVDSAADVVSEEIDGGDDTIESAASRTLGSNIENLRLSGSANVSGTGNTLANSITGNSGANTLQGLAGNDVLVGGGGTDTLAGGDDNDMLVGGSGNDVFDGGNGIDTASFRAAASTISVDLAITATTQNTGYGQDRLTGIENVLGSDTGNDFLQGDANANRLFGSGGGDVLDGRAGADTLQGGEGNDTLTGGADNDTLDGGNGFDTASYAGAATGVTVDLSESGAQATGDGTDRLAGIEGLLGSATGNDTLTGDYQANTIDGNGGNDLIEGGDGADTLSGGAGTDTISYAGSVGDVMVNLGTGAANDGFGARDVISGFENIVGSQFDDTLRGDGGANVIEGGTGRDVIRGGAGADIFVYRNLSDSTLATAGRDTIIDFVTGDKIDLSLIDADSTTVGDQAFTFIGTGAFTKVAGQLRATTTSIEADVNGDGFVDFAITIGVSPAPVGTDFIL
jgi:Ca2+-binding RTX toxin-like protein